MEKYLYLAVNLFAISFPLVRSFESKIRYASKWYALFPALIISATLFLIWDHWFTVIGIWEFNPRYLLGIYIFELPIEEWLFFFTVPFACVFIYEVLIYFFPKDIFQPAGKPFVFVMIPVLLVLAFINLDKMYTSVNFFVGAFALAIHWLIFKNKYMGRFLFAYLVHLIPFILFNGILTGGLTSEPVVIYNNAENLGIRIWTVPIEDTIYSMTLLLMNVSLFEYFRNRKTIQEA
ncbi:lycopene cyclase domain-containing protein [Algoriphagus ratkowskyi]|uniref:Lycopene cyclase domain-containing protein n=1 Tax=Algoriphagus ratkowskyi TaxID=57028 RepID=A0A2W7RG61_9BACT|nr:lycopene cyclase domain-containing protein [Algoriphagus ratkowskyi]PZX54557.1 lycopene cyclase domain-containing protein [Algoriphagus ratkowskyi]TXD76876.1 lycopene cyclase domain-containing protein [Algoriphagus ratkowskyi]